MVNFASFSMPVQYGTHGISASHLHTRSKVSVFDVSHMLQTIVRGKDRDAWLESICVADVLGEVKNYCNILSSFTKGFMLVESLST